MTDYYVDSNNGAPSSPYANWTDAANTVKAAIDAGAGALDTIYVHTGASNPHTESSTADISWAGPVNASSGLLTIVGVDQNNSDAYTISTTANITLTSGYDLRVDGAIAIFGLKIACTGTGYCDVLCDLDEYQYYQDITVDASSSTATQYVRINGGANATFNNCTFDNGADDANISIVNTVNVYFIGCDFSGTNTSLEVFYSSTVKMGFIGCDFSGITGSGALFFDALSNRCDATLVGCRIPSTLTIGDELCRVSMYETDTDSGNNQYRTELIGQISQATCDVDTGTYRTGGATYDGTNGYSWVLNATDADIVYPPATTAWNTGFLDATGSTTFTVYIANATADYTDAQVWLEVEYFGSTTTTLKTIGSDGVGDPISAGTTQTDDSTSTWSPTKTYMQSLSVTATVNKVGSFRWRVCSTVAVDIYVDPAIEVA